jgi:hypothetical protein
MGLSISCSEVEELQGLVQAQLAALCRWYRLGADVAGRLRDTLGLLGEESMARPAVQPFQGLSFINQSGLPLQWVVRASAAGSGFGFVCEAGRPGTPALARLRTTREALQKAQAIFGQSTPAWLGTAESHLCPREDERWPEEWLSAIWIGVSCAHDGAAFKPYFNLDRGPWRDRWLRAGWVLKSLGREESLRQLCELSKRAPAGSAPVGLAVDIDGRGTAGRVKVYFRSEGADPRWLAAWFEAAAHRDRVPLMRRCLDLFPWFGRGSADGAFTLSVEFHPAGGALGLKTDLAVAAWMADDRCCLEAAAALSAEIGADPHELEAAVRTLGTPAVGQRIVRLVGVGFEPDNQSHVNVYLEPPLGRAPAVRPDRSTRSPSRALIDGQTFLLARQSHGQFVDFDLPVGRSDEWVTAYVLANLEVIPAQMRASGLDQAIADGLDWLLTRVHADGGWGYNGAVESDADSTAWAVLALRRGRRAVPATAVAFLRRCASRRGVSTYPSGGVAGGSWTEPAPDVTVVAAHVGGVVSASAVLRCLESWRRSDGSVPAYWWASQRYTLAMLLEVRPAVASGTSRIARAVRDTASRLARLPAGGAFEEALSLRLLNATGSDDAPTVDRIVRSQGRDGGWTGSAVLRLSDPGYERPFLDLATGPLFVDVESIFTTATVVGALANRAVGVELAA